MGRCIVKMDVVCPVWATTLLQLNTGRGDTMKNVTMYFALALVFVLGTDAVYGQFEEKAETKKPRNYWTEIQETRRGFGMASEALTTKEQQDFLAVCQKARETGVVQDAFCNCDKVALRICWPGPFYSKEGR